MNLFSSTKHTPFPTHDIQWQAKTTTCLTSSYRKKVKVPLSFIESLRGKKYLEMKDVCLVEEKI